MKKPKTNKHNKNRTSPDKIQEIKSHTLQIFTKHYRKQQIRKDSNDWFNLQYRAKLTNLNEHPGTYRAQAGKNYLIHNFKKRQE